MSQNPRRLQDRFPAELRRLVQSVKRLETRTNAIDGGFPLAALPGVVSPSYTSGDPAVQVNGQVDGNGNPVYSGPFQHLASYTPAAGDSVLVLPCGPSSTYYVLGRLA